MEFFVYPYKLGSASAKLLADCLGAKRIRRDGEYTSKPNHVVVNWGNGHIPYWPIHPESVFLNPCRNVCWAINKLESFAMFLDAGIAIPPTTQSSHVARNWLDRKLTVIGRQEVEGTRGSGIVLMKSRDDYIKCNLYSQFIPNTQEYRVYVFDGKSIDVLQKRRDTEMLEKGLVNEDIRTEENGWVFCRYSKQGTTLQVPTTVTQEACRAVKALGLLYGGVDIIHDPKYDRTYALEVNTAPGIYGETVKKYAECIRAYVSH